MSKALFITSQQADKVRVSELHANFWYLGGRRAFLDLGLMLRVDKGVIGADKEVVITCFLPFHVKKGSLVDLSRFLRSEDTLQLLFNDGLDSIRSIAAVPGVGPASLIRFRSGRRFVLVHPVLQYLDAENGLEISLDLDNLDLGLMLSEYQTDKDVPLYIRFRYQIDVKTTGSLYFDRRMLHDQVHIDFRFNEPRLISGLGQDYLRRLVPIEKIYVFSIQPTFFSVVREPSTQRKYVRLLELDREGWKKYLDGMIKSGGNYLVYHWKEDLDDGQLPTVRYFNMLVSLEAEKVDVSKQITFASAVALLAIALLIGPKYVDWAFIVGQYGNVALSALQWIGGAFLAVALGIASSAVYDFFKDLYRQRRDKVGGV